MDKSLLSQNLKVCISHLGCQLLIPLALILTILALRAVTEYVQTGQTYRLVTVFFQCCGFNSTCAYSCGSQLEIFKQTVHAEAVCTSSQPLRGTISMGGPWPLLSSSQVEVCNAGCLKGSGSGKQMVETALITTSQRIALTAQEVMVLFSLNVTMCLLLQVDGLTAPLSARASKMIE